MSCGSGFDKTDTSLHFYAYAERSIPLDTDGIWKKYYTGKEPPLEMFDGKVRVMPETSRAQYFEDYIKEVLMEINKAPA